MLKLLNYKKVLSDILIKVNHIGKNIISKLIEKDIKRLLLIDNSDVK